MSKLGGKGIRGVATGGGRCIAEWNRAMGKPRGNQLEVTKQVPHLGASPLAGVLESLNLACVIAPKGGVSIPTTSSVTKQVPTCARASVV
jgi:hypothetical protein